MRTLRTFNNNDLGTSGIGYKFVCLFLLSPIMAIAIFIISLFSLNTDFSTKLFIIFAILFVVYIFNRMLKGFKIVKSTVKKLEFNVSTITIHTFGGEKLTLESKKVKVYTSYKSILGDSHNHLMFPKDAEYMYITHSRKKYYIANSTTEFETLKTSLLALNECSAPNKAIKRN